MSYGNPDLFHLPKLICRLDNSLTRLKFDFMTFTESQLLECLSGVPSFKHLSLGTGTLFATTRTITGEIPPTIVITDATLGTLTPRETQGSYNPFLCSQLEVFECKDWAAFCEDSLATFIENRRALKYVTLRSVTTYFDRKSSLDLRGRLYHVIEDGFELVLRYYDGRKSTRDFSAWSGVSSMEMVPEWAQRLPRTDKAFP
jgi:hypothetical protein